MQSFCNTCIKLAFVITHCIAGAFGDKNIFNQIFFMHFKNECEQHVIRGEDTLYVTIFIDLYYRKQYCYINIV